LVTGNAGANIQVGSVRVTPTATSVSPAAMAIFSFKRSGITVSEASVTAEQSGSAFRVYLESNGAAAQIGSIRTGLAIVNTSAVPAELTLAIRSLDGGAIVHQANLSLQPGAQIARFIHELVSNFPNDFQGTLELTSTAPVVVSGLRGRYNERGDFLMTTTPPRNEAAPPTNSELVFPHVVNGGGYTTQLILLGPTAAGRLWFLTKEGVLTSIQP